MLIGYARVSTGEQDTALQVNALKASRCERIFTDHMSGAKSDRPGLREALNQTRPGDTLVVWRLDRLGRSLTDLVRIVSELEREGVGFRSLTESIDTTTPGGKLVFHVFAALAEFERDLIRERTNTGLAAARSRGRLGGRPPKLDAKKAAMAKRMHADPNNSVGSICDALGVSRATLYRYLASGSRSAVETGARD